MKCLIFIRLIKLKLNRLPFLPLLLLGGVKGGKEWEHYNYFGTSQNCHIPLTNITRGLLYGVNWLAVTIEYMEMRHLVTGVVLQFPSCNPSLDG